MVRVVLAAGRASPHPVRATVRRFARHRCRRDRAADRRVVDSPFMAVTYRPATLDDAALASDLMTRAYPPLPQDPGMTRYRSALLLAYCAEDEPEMLDALAQLEYKRARTAKVWELDLQGQGPRLILEAADARARMDGAGIRLLTLADWADAEKFHKLHALDERTVQDIPHTLTIVPETFEH